MMKYRYKGMYSYRYLLSALSGLLLCLSFSIEYLWWIAFFALCPLMYILLKYRIRKRTVALIVLVFSIFYYVPLLRWLLLLKPIVPMPESKAGIVLALGLFFIAVVEGLYMFIALMFFHNIKSVKIYDIFTLSGLFVLAEFLQEYTFILAFPWSKAGTIVSQFTVFIQSASLFGTLFVSWLVYLLNALFTYLIINKRHKKRIIKSSIIVGILIVTNIIYGFIRVNFNTTDCSYKATAIQGNYPKLQKWKTDNYKIFDTYLNLSKASLETDTKIIVWPESAISRKYNSDEFFKENLIKFSKDNNVVIVTGVILKNDEDTRYNSLLAFSPDGSISEPYYKRKLVPFGEYFPLGDFLGSYIPSLCNTVSQTTTYEAGESAVILNSSLCKIGGIICYDSLFSSVIRENIENGAELLVLVSNDSWFGKSKALYQHNSHAIMRSVEADRYIISSSNTGITSIINNRGEIIIEAPIQEQTFINGIVSPKNTRTLYSIIGDIIAIPCSLIFVYSVYCRVFKNYKIKIKKY